MFVSIAGLLPCVLAGPICDLASMPRGLLLSFPTSRSGQIGKYIFKISVWTHRRMVRKEELCGLPDKTAAKSTLQTYRIHVAYGGEESR